jgi:methylenetetrahydrofolate--tRNA-(uracil-5-)-methyltransferase
MTSVKVVGAGLAGSEAAWQLCKRGIPVELIEMKPVKKTPAHVIDTFAELVCSNSLRSDELTNAVGLLKEEMRRLDSIVMWSADKNRLPAGGALAVDRVRFSQDITDRLREHPLVTVTQSEITDIPEGRVIIATGPLTADTLAERLVELSPNNKCLNFYDAAAPS